MSNDKQETTLDESHKCMMSMLNAYAAAVMNLGLAPADCDELFLACRAEKHYWDAMVEAIEEHQEQINAVLANLREARMASHNRVGERELE